MTFTEGDFQEAVYANTPTRKSRLETYLYDETMIDSLEVATQLYDPDKPLNRTVVAIPVAAHQESPETISRTLDLYAVQKLAEPFSVCLLLNCPTDQHASKEVTKTLLAVSEAKRKHRDVLDIRSAIATFKEPVIGEIRKSLWDGIAHVSLKEGAYEALEDEVIVINNDIDAEYMSPRYIHNVQRFYERSQGRRNQLKHPSELLPLAGTGVRHALRPETHPNTSGAVLWADMAYRQLQDAGLGGAYEAGLVVPLSYYARQGGFDPEARTYESGFLHGRHFIAEKAIKSTTLLTSPRRYLEMFPATGYNIWSDETFGANDDCRTQVEADLADTSQEELDMHVREKTKEWGSWYLYSGIAAAKKRFDRAINKSALQFDLDAADEEAHAVIKIIRARTNLAHKVLKNIVGSPVNADLLPTEEDVVSTAVKLLSVYEQKASENENRIS